MNFWHGLLIGWFLGMATIPFFMVVVAKLLARSYDRQEHEKRMSARWLRQRADRGAHVSPEAARFLKDREEEEARKRGRRE